MSEYYDAYSIELDPEEEYGNLVVANSIQLDDESPVPQAPPWYRRVVGAASGVAHTARAIAETGAGLATGLVAFPVSKGTKWIEYVLSGGDLEKAKAAELKANERIQFQPTTPEAQGAMEQIGKYVMEPVFGTLKEMGRLPGESWKSPAMSELGGDVAEIGGPILLGTGVKAGLRSAKERLRLREESPVERPIETLPERPIERPAEIPPERILKERIPEEPAKVVPAESIKLDEAVSPVAETLSEVKVKTTPKEIVEPAPISEVKTGGGTESRQAIRAEADAIAAKLTEDFGNLVEYKSEPGFMKEQASRAAEVLETDYGKAKRIAMGEEKPPEGIRPATMYEAVKIRAIKEGDVETLHKLATESKVPTLLSEYGKEIKAADSRIMEDPVKVMQDVATARADKIERLTGKKTDTATVAKAGGELSLAEQKLLERETSVAIKKLQNDIAKEQRQTKRVYAKEELSLEFDTLSKDLNKLLGGQLNVGIDPAAALILGKMAKNRIQAGIITVEGVVDSIYTSAKNMGVELSKRDIMDAISGYGKYKLLNKDEVLVTLRDLKGQMQQLSKLEDLQSGTPPLKTGVERRIPSVEERKLIKQVEDAKKKYGIEVIDKETQLKSALDKVKTGLKNSIEDITYQIETGERIAKGKGVKLDLEAIELKKQRDFLATLRDALEEPVPKFTYEKPGELPVKKQRVISQEQRINMAIKAAERMSAEYAKRVISGELSAKKKGVNVLEVPELVEARDVRDGWKSLVQEMKDASDPKKTPEQIALQSLKTRLRNEAKKYSEKLQDLDMAKREKTAYSLDAEANLLKEKRDIAKKNYDIAAQKGGVVTKEEAARIVELSKTVSDAKRNYDPATETWTSIQDAKVYGASKVVFERYAENLKEERLTLRQAAKEKWMETKTRYAENKAKAVTGAMKDAITSISDNAISFVASIDNSFLGRQGLNTLMTHPSVWVPTARKSFVDIYQTIKSKHGGDAVRDAVLADVYSNPNYMNGSYQLAKLLPKTEEQYPTMIPERLPLGVGRAFKASSNAFINSGTRMRTGTFDLLRDIAKRQGKDITDPVWIKDVGTLINSLTARGDLGKLGQGGVVRLVMWAPKMLKGNWDVLTAHTGTAGLETSFAKKQAIINIAKIVGETAAIAAITNAIKPGSVETNPVSTDFMKIKVGKTRFDITGGKGSLVTLIARAVSAQSKSVITGKVTPLNSGQYGAKTIMDVGIDFLVNKTTPLSRVAVNRMKGETFKHEKPTLGGDIYSLTTPITIQNFIDNIYGKDADASLPAVIGSVADFIGINANTYGPLKKQKN